MEHPRPQPHASYTLIFLLLIAAISQIVGEVLRPIGSEEQEQEIASDSENPTRTHLLKVSKFLTWTPKKASAFLPKLFRPNEDVEEEQLIVEEINDDILINDLAAHNDSYELDDEDGIEFLASNSFNEDDIEFLPNSESLSSSPSHTQQFHKKSAHTNTQDIKPSLAKLPKKKPKKVTQEVKGDTTASSKSPIVKQSKPKISQAEMDAQQKKPQAKQLSSSHADGTKGNVPKTQAQLSATQQKNSASDPTPSAQKKNSSPSSSQKSKNKSLIGSKDLVSKKDSTPPPRKKRKRKRRRYTKSGILIYGIDDPSSALKPFYHKLSTIKSKGNKVKIAHYGDSLIAGDYVTRTVRRLLQKTFGDAGHGFFLSGKGSRWYGRRWINLKSKGKWTKKRFSKAKKLGEEFGLGGVSFTSSAKGAWVRAKTTGVRLGSKVDFFELHYLAHPGGGSFKIEFAGQSQEVNTAAESKHIKLIKIKAPKSGKWQAKVTLNGDGKVTLYGFTFERNQGGIVYDSLGLEGARAKLLLKLTTNEWTKQIRKRNPDLYVLHYGTNESVNAKMNMNKYKQSLKQVIKRFKRALPKSACLLVSPMDRAQKDGETGKIKSMRIVSKIVQAQREVSAAEGCAFWSTYDAMGGRGSMARWYNASPKLAGGDLTHPTSSGANRIGAMFFAALMDAYKKR